MLNFTNACLNACWEIYGGVDEDHLPSSGAAYNISITRGGKQTFPWAPQWDIDEGKGELCYAHNITESHTAEKQTVLWNITKTAA